MDNRNPQYQRAVTPSIDNNVVQSGMIRGKVLSYNNINSIRNKVNNNNNTVTPVSTAISHSRSNVNSPRSSFSHNEMSILGKNNSTQSPNKILNSPSQRTSGNRSNLEGNLFPSELSSNLLTAPRYDLVPTSEDIPSDGIIFAKYRNNADSLVVYRTNEERARNPERLNLDKRQLEVCPLLEQEQRLRLLNYQNNNIRIIQNLENLPNLIFLDLYNNKITSLNGSLTLVKGLRVLMAGKNKITSISNLSPLRKLDVLDLHSNDINTIEGLDGLSDLRVLNLAGNKIGLVNNSLSSLVSLTELNLRRNKIEFVTGLNKLPALQRVFLSHNLINSIDDIKCLFDITYLIELCLDGNPLSERDPVLYRQQIVNGISGLRHLDLKKVNDEERTLSDTMKGLNNRGVVPSNPGEPGASEPIKSSTDLNNDSNLQSHTVNSTVNMNNSDTNNAFTLNTHRQEIRSSGVQKYGQVEGETNEVVIDSTIITTTNPSVFSDEKQSSSVVNTNALQTLTSLAKSGKINSAHSLFDVEIIGPDEKAIVIVGDNWEWSSSKRLLGNVIEASICYTKRQTIISKFTSLQVQNNLPSLKTIRFYSNDFVSFNNLEFIPALCGNQVQSLTIKSSPICNSTSPQLLRSYFIATIPSLKTFNEVEITEKDRIEAIQMYSPLIKAQQILEDKTNMINRYNNSIGVISQSERSNISYKSFQKNLMNNHSSHINSSSNMNNNSISSLSENLGNLKQRIAFSDNVSMGEINTASLTKDSSSSSSSSLIRQQRNNFHDFLTSFDTVMNKISIDTLREITSSQNMTNSNNNLH